jgi:hypothetical protein
MPGTSGETSGKVREDEEEWELRGGRRALGGREGVVGRESGLEREWEAGEVGREVRGAMVIAVRWVRCRLNEGEMRC